MPSATVRISSTTQRMLRELAANTGESMQSLLDKAIEAYRRERFLDQANEAFAALRRDPKKWKAELEERNAWDATLAENVESN